MKKTNITSILKEILTENEDNLNIEYLATLKGFLESRLIPTINKGIDIDGISQEFADRLISDIRKVLDEVSSGKSAIRGDYEVKESALSPGYLTNVYSPRGVLEATVYTDGGVSITLRNGERKIKMTAAIPLSELTEDYLKKLIESGFKFSESLQKEIIGLLSKLDSNEKVQSVKNIDNN